MKEEIKTLSFAELMESQVLVAASSDKDPVPETVSDIIVKHWGDKVEQVILFGSRARGDFNEDSDYDFIVIGEYGDLTLPYRMMEINSTLGRLIVDYELEILPFTRTEFETKFLFSRAVSKEGIILYERGNYSLDG